VARRSDIPAGEDCGGCYCDQGYLKQDLECAVLQRSPLRAVAALRFDVFMEELRKSTTWGGEFKELVKGIALKCNKRQDIDALLGFVTTVHLRLNRTIIPVNNAMLSIRTTSS
jgi:hypothetical protein